MMLLRHHAALHLFNDQAEAITVLKVSCCCCCCCCCCCLLQMLFVVDAEPKIILSNEIKRELKVLRLPHIYSPI